MLSKTIALAAITASFAAAGPPARPVAPKRPFAPTFSTQTINCGGAANPYCCSPSTINNNSGGLTTEGKQSGGTTCSKMTGSAQCNALVICCNNNGGSPSGVQCVCCWIGAALCFCLGCLKWSSNEDSFTKSRMASSKMEERGDECLAEKRPDTVRSALDVSTPI